ncbi:uncharacterized protein A4U43_C10F100 [Asparagus officinalis]|uniref:Uncharacterized protein n=1 Tax=Asparagus officinalis TaxID=4686 RepID=A0A5P1DZY6_ASPOF|nr:uncharacterized protein A4U43_C10F100 [Asparagus officinalis]
MTDINLIPVAFFIVPLASPLGECKIIRKRVRKTNFSEIEERRGFEDHPFSKSPLNVGQGVSMWMKLIRDESSSTEGRDCRKPSMSVDTSSRQSAGFHVAEESRKVHCEDVVSHLG